MNMKEYTFTEEQLFKMLISAYNKGAINATTPTTSTHINLYERNDFIGRLIENKEYVI